MYRSNSDEPHSNNNNIELMQHGIVTLRRILELLQPGAVDPSLVVGRRVRWAYSCTRTNSDATKRASDELKQLHLSMGAVEVLVHRAPWAKEETE